MKCEEEVASANSIIVKGGIGGSQLTIGKELLYRVIGMGEFRENNFREWRHTLVTSLYCIDQDIYDEIMKLDRRGKEDKSLWVYPKLADEDEKPHLPVAIDKKLQLILVNSISDRESKSLST